jgi:hypothetical protein
VSIRLFFSDFTPPQGIFDTDQAGQQPRAAPAGDDARKTSGSATPGALRSIVR